MATTPEGSVKHKVKELLVEYGAHYFMPVQMGYGQTHLDFICCYNGRYLAIETKAEGKAITQKQFNTMRAIDVAGGVALLIVGHNDLPKLRLYLEANKTNEHAHQPYTQDALAGVQPGYPRVIPARKNNPI